MSFRLNTHSRGLNYDAGKACLCGRTILRTMVPCISYWGVMTKGCRHKACYLWDLPPRVDAESSFFVWSRRWTVDGYAVALTFHW